MPPPLVRYCSPTGDNDGPRRDASLRTQDARSHFAEFKREVAQQRANGASEVDIQEMLGRIESVNRAVMDADQLAYFMELFREAAAASSETGQQAET